MRVALRCTLSQSVLSSYRCLQHDMLKTKGELTDSQLGANSEPLIQQMRVSCRSKQTRIARQPKLTSRKREIQQRRRDSSVNGKEQPCQRGSIDMVTLLDLCVSSQRSPNTITRLSHNSISHFVVGVIVVVIGCPSQHPAFKRLS